MKLSFMNYFYLFFKFGVQVSVEVLINFFSNVLKNLT